MSRAHPAYSPAPTLAKSPARSSASLLAIIGALASFVFSFRGQELLALLLAFIAIAAGLIGGVKALSPRITGGMLSLSAVILGVLAILVALIALIV